MRRPLVIFTVAAIALASLAASVSLAGPKKKAFRVEGVPFEIAEEGTPPKHTRGTDGRLHFEQKLRVKIDGETAERPVTMKASHADAAQGGDLHVTITENTGNKAS